MEQFGHCVPATAVTAFKLCVDGTNTGFCGSRSALGQSPGSWWERCFLWLLGDRQLRLPPSQTSAQTLW